MYCAFWKCYDGFELYSPIKLKQVPLQGFLFPVELFDVEEINE
jgi:hypothetical protein